LKVSLQALALTASLAVLTGCAAPSTPPPAPVNAPPSTAPKPRVEPPDTCGLRAVKGLVGQPRSAIPVPVNPQLRRVTCTRCVQAQDYNPRRLNIYYDADTGVIERLACG